MIGTKLGHYRILEPLGAGGMGVVYRARDEHLDRDVAIKILPPGALADETARRLFRKEALALSKLSHPNIETVHDFDSQGDVDFLVLELISGESLRQRIQRGPLPEREIAKIGEQLAEGLAAAHKAGVLHRDIKPGNLHLTSEGRLKILDFGLAKRIRMSDMETTESHTDVGPVAGTLPYMSPEQIRDERMDQRTDLYAAGAVLYEMACGRMAFPQETPPAVIGAILTGPVVAPRELNHGLSPEMERIILKCLEKQAEDRFQSAGELAVDLRRHAQRSSAAISSPARTPHRHRKRRAVALTAAAMLAVMLLALTVPGAWDRLLRGSSPSAIHALAVLPFTNLSVDPDQEYFADGMTEQLIAALGQFSGLDRIISRSSVMQYKRNMKPLPAIARELDVHAIVEGSVQRFQDRVQITVKLIDAPSDRFLWGKSFESFEVDILKLQHEIARSIAQEIRLELTPEEKARLARPTTVDPRAYDAYLKGLISLDQYTESAITQGRDHFLDAIRIDPAYAPAHAGLATAYFYLSTHHMPAREAMPRAKTAATHALELDPELAAAHGILACVTGSFDWQWAEADASFRRAVALEPGNALNHVYYGMHLIATRRFDEARAELHRARELDPLSIVIRQMTPWPLYFERRYDDLIDANHKLIALDSLVAGPHYGLGVGYLQKGQLGTALLHLSTAVRLDSTWTGFKVALGFAHAVSGNTEEATRILEDLTRVREHAHVPPVHLAVLHAGLGHRNEALDWLERGFEERDENMLWIASEPMLDGLRSDPRFQDLQQRMRF